MAPSTAPVHEPYEYERPSATLTRDIVSEPSKPSDITPEYHTPATHPAHSHQQRERGIHRTKSTNYQQALADRAVDTTSDPSSAEPKVVGGLAYRGDNANASTSRPGVVGRQQSWKASDQKRAQIERMLSSDTAKPGIGGYTSTTPGKQ